MTSFLTARFFELHFPDSRPSRRGRFMSVFPFCSSLLRARSFPPYKVQLLRDSFDALAFFIEDILSSAETKGWGHHAHRSNGDLYAG